MQVHSAGHDESGGEGGAVVDPMILDRETNKNHLEPPTI